MCDEHVDDVSLHKHTHTHTSIHKYSDFLVCAIYVGLVSAHPNYYVIHYPHLGYGQGFIMYPDCFVYINNQINRECSVKLMLICTYQCHAVPTTPQEFACGDLCMGMRHLR